MLTPADMATYSIAPLTQDDVVRLLAGVTIGDLYAAESPFDVLTTAGMRLLHPLTVTHNNTILRFAFAHVPEWGWIPISFGPSLRKTREETTPESWEGSPDRLGLLVKALTKPLTGVREDLTAVLMTMAEHSDDKSVYNMGYWSPVTHHLLLTLQHLQQTCPEDFDTVHTLIGLAHPNALVMLNRLQMWLNNNAPQRRSEAYDFLEMVALDTWPSFVMDGTDVSGEDVVEHFIASVPHEQWTSVRVRQYLREESRVEESPVRRALVGEFVRHGDFLPEYGHGTSDLSKINLDDYDFFLHPDRRQVLSPTIENTARLDALYQEA
jgi:hypothetical protein